MPDGKLWIQRDRFGNDIYLTRERWTHIVDSDNHPEIEPFRIPPIFPGVKKMNETKVNYDKEGDVLYVSFGRSEHVVGVELADNVLLRLDTGKSTGTPPRAIGLTFVSFARMMAHYRERPISVPLANLRNLPEDLWQAVITVITTAPVSDFLAVGLSLSPQVPPLPEQVVA
jgi:hypothetical protein